MKLQHTSPGGKVGPSLPNTVQWIEAQLRAKKIETDSACKITPGLGLAFNLANTTLVGKLHPICVPVFDSQLKFRTPASF